MESAVRPDKTMNALKPYPSKLYVETTTRCNLRCAMCVKQAEGACIPEADMSMDVFRSLQPAFPHIDALILNGIGEPLLTPGFIDMIRLARQSMRADASIRFQTNGMLLSPDMASALVDAGLDTVCLSVDMVSEFGLFHGGEDVGRIVHAFAHLREAAQRSGRPVSIGVEFVLMRDNAESLPRSLEWAADQGADFALVSHMLPYDESMANQELFNPNTEKSMAEFAQWKREAEALGIDLNAYFGSGWKMIKSPRQQAALDFVNERRKDALSRNIPIHFSRLLEWSTPEKQAEQEWLRALLDKARAVAEKRGLAVTLPAVAATHDRQCDFVEQGVAHITATGDVRPCYFLWHEYSCHMDGGRKKVLPKTFGNVAETPILDIWNSEEYRTFRSLVLEYDYPYCSNCSVVPCSDVTGHMGEFQHDCYGATIPCGHCNWCMGASYCLL